MNGMNRMNEPTRELDSSGLRLGPLGLGCWPLAGMTREGVGREAAVSTVEAALESGVLHLDTAYCYGERGESETAIAAAIRRRGIPREHVAIAGKCGIHWEPDASRSPPRRQCVDGRPERLRSEVEESLRRLETDRLDLLYLHAPDPQVPISESAGELRRLHEEGKTRAVGVSNVKLHELQAFANECRLAACQMPFNMLQRDIEQDILPWCRSHGVGVIAYWPLMKGLLAGRMGRSTTFPASDSRHKYPLFNGDEFQRNLDFVERLRPVAERLRCTVADVVLAWTAEQPGIESVLFGATSPEQVHENAAAMQCMLDEEARRAIAEAIAWRGPAAARVRH